MNKYIIFFASNNGMTAIEKVEVESIDISQAIFSSGVILQQIISVKLKIATEAMSGL